MKIEPEQMPARTGPTYADLEVEVGKLQRRDAAMVRSVLNAWREIHGLADDTPLGPEIGTGYPDALATFIEGRSVGKKTSYGDKSRMGAIQKVAESLITSADVVRETFSESLREAVAASGKSIYSLAKACGTNSSTIRSWIHGRRTPGDAKSFDYLAAIERELGILPGTISQTLPQVPATSILHPQHRKVRETPFAAMLKKAISAKGWTLAEAARQAGIKGTRLWAWIQRRVFPGLNSRLVDLPRLAAALDIELGKITATLPEVALPQRPYALGPLSTKQQREWNAFKQHKTDKMLDYAPEQYWRIKADGSCPTETRTLKQMGEFWGWISTALPPGTREEDDIRAKWNVNPKEVGFLDLLRAGAVEAYVKWRATRQGDETRAVYTSSHTAFLILVTGLLRKETGYLWHAHTVDFTRAASLGILKGTNGAVPTKKEWRTHCKTTRKTLKKFLKKIMKHGITHRDTRAHLQGIVSQDRPLDYLDLMVKGLSSDIDRFIKLGRSPQKIAVMVRDLLLLSLICDVPMRLSQWEHLTYRADNTGHLRRAPEGANYDYQIVIPQEEMKRPKAHGRPFEAPIAREHTPLVEKYLLGTPDNTPYRALLDGGDDLQCVLVFRPAKRAGQDPLRRFNNLDLRVLHWSEKYLAEVLNENRGFRTHALRHIIATHFVKTYGDPDGVNMAAEVLGNTPEMIRIHYGFLTSMEKSTKALTLVQTERRRGQQLRDGKNNPEAAA